MSYILEALKKLEQKREQEGQPRLFIFSRGSRSERKKRSSWPYLLAAALFLNAAAITWWVNERQGEKGGTVAEKAAVPRQAAPPAPFAAPERRLAPIAEEVGRKRETPAAPAAVARDVPQSPAVKAVQAEKPTAPAQGRQKEQSKKAHGPVLQVDELPSEVRSALPEFRISGHAYSPDPQTRVARINEKILQEGQELTPGLKLVEITKEGVIFGYRGYRFRVDLNGIH